MAPRRYEMRSRAAAVEETRQRIVTSAIRIFAAKTAAATSMEDVAAAAGVSPATVYRHFRDFDSLADACAKTAFDISEVPTPEVAALQFSEIPELAGKLARFIEISCHCYERAADWLSAERRERHLPAFARTVAREQAALDAIVRGLLEPAQADELTIAVVKTLVDFPFWQSLIGAGVEPTQVPRVMESLVCDRLAEQGIALRPAKTGDNYAPARPRRPRHAARPR